MSSRRSWLKFKAKAARATTPQEMWSVGEYLARTQRAVEAKYDYRYSRLLEVFGVLLSEKRLEEHELGGLGAEKLAVVRRIAGFMSGVRGAR